MKTRASFCCLLWAAMFSCTQAMGENLLVYDADSGEQISGKTVMISSKNCRPFVDSFNRSDLPKEFDIGIDEPSVERPAFNSFELAGTLNNFEHGGQHFLRPGMTVSWGEPVSKLAKAHTQGYLLIWQTTKWMSCRLFKVDNAELRQKLRFKYEIEFLYALAGYKVRIYSMPPPETLEQSQNEDTFVTLNITAGSMISNFKDPGNWVPSISVKHGEKSVTVRIVHAPEQFNLTEFDVMLLRYGKDPVNPIETKRYVAPPYSTKQSSGFITFNNLTVSDDYRVVVHVLDPFPSIPDQCLCYNTSKQGIKLCKVSCGAITSEWAPLVIKGSEGDKTGPVEDVNDSEEKTTESDVLPDDGNSGVTMAGGGSPDNRPIESQRGMSDAVLAAIIATCSTLALVVLILSILFLKRRKKNQSEFPLPRNKEILSMPGDLKGPLDSQTVYIIYAEDHPEQMKAVENFATFLSAHGKCNVIFPPWEDVNSEGITQWSTYALERAGHLLFIDSVAAERLLSGFNVRRVYVPTKPLTSQCNQLLRLARDHVYNVPGTKDRVRVVHFRKDCGSQRFLAAPHMFHLPSRLPELLQCIHGLSTKQAKALNYTLPVAMEDFSQVPEGAFFLTSIKASAEYEDSHPNWFEERYVQAKLELQTQASERSVESGIFSMCDRLGSSGAGSVSTQDLSSLGQGGGSPSSVFEAVEFPGCPLFDGLNEHNRQAPVPSQGDGDVRRDSSGCSAQVEESSIFTVGHNILNGPLQSVIPPGSGSTLGQDTFSSHLRFLNNDDSQSTFTTSTAMTGVSLGQVAMGHNASQMADETRSSFERSLRPPPEQLHVDNFSAALRSINSEGEEDKAFSDTCVGSDTRHGCLESGVAFV